MPATNRYFNVGPVTFTPDGGTLITITGVQSFGFNPNISTKKESGDFDAFPTVGLQDYQDPTVTLTTLDAWALSSVLAGDKGTLVITHRDAYNGAALAGGAKIVTITDAWLQEAPVTGNHRAFGTRSLTFGAISADGVTSPVTITSA